MLGEASHTNKESISFGIVLNEGRQREGHKIDIYTLDDFKANPTIARWWQTESSSSTQRTSSLKLAFRYPATVWRFGTL